ncbi:MAG: choice-of-anchor Q domain-containing protein [Bacteroidota bacterium]
MAKGAYKPTKTHEFFSAQFKTFFIAQDIQLYGGFFGNETALSQRDWENNKTILSGDLDGNDANVDGNNIAETTADLVGNNAHHVLWLDHVSDAMRLDGFFITAGKADYNQHPFSEGGGMYVDGSEAAGVFAPILANLVFSGNYAIYGGALANYGYLGAVNPALFNCIFSGNEASEGGGAIFNFAHEGSAAPVGMNCHFYNNSAKQGGAVYTLSFWSVSNPGFTNCSFTANSASEEGGAMFNISFNQTATASPVLFNCTFFGNSAGSDGGAIFNHAAFSDASPKLTNCSFAENTAERGLVIFNFNELASGTANPLLTNCILWGNDGAGSSIFNDAAAPVLRYTLLEETDCPPGAVCESSVLLNQNPLFEDVGNNNLRLSPGSPAIDVGDNSAVPPSLLSDLDGNQRIFNATNIAVARVDLGAYEFGATSDASDIAGAAALALSVFPNPASSHIFLEYELPGASEIKVSLFDFMGKELAVLAQDKRAGGSAREEMVLPEGLAAGCYWVLLRTNFGIVAAEWMK